VYCAVNRLGAAVANRTVKGCFVKGESGNPRGRPKATTERRWEARARREVYRQVSNVVVEARKFLAWRLIR
jgi:hypothetical protein